MHSDSSRQQLNTCKAPSAFSPELTCWRYGVQKHVSSGHVVKTQEPPRPLPRSAQPHGLGCPTLSAAPKQGGRHTSGM